MQAFALVAILWLGAAQASTSLEATPPGRTSQIVEKLQRIFCLGADGAAATSPSTPDGIQLDDDLLGLPTGILLERFGTECLRAAIRMENAPPGHIVLVIIEELLRSDHLPAAIRTENAPGGLISQITGKLLGPDQLRFSQLVDRYVLEALELAYDVGHCDLIPVLSDHLRNSPSYRGNFSSPHFERASCDDVARLAALPLGKLLGMHALPRSTFLQVIHQKYRRSGYGSFFHDPAWNSRLRSSTVMSHALHLYEELKGEYDFEPVPFGRIASTQSISELTQKILEDNRLSSCDLSNILSYLQLVLKPESNVLGFWKSSLDFKTKFLVEACDAGRVDWIKFMVEHDFLSNVWLPSRVICRFGTLGRGRNDFVLLYDDLLKVDPALSAFELVFNHQMGRHSSHGKYILQRVILLRECATHYALPLADPARQIVRAYIS